MFPKAPRHVSEKALIKVLSKYGYEVVRQTGNHIRLSISLNDGIKSVTISNHDPLKLGTLMAIINDASEQLKIKKEDIISKL